MALPPFAPPIVPLFVSAAIVPEFAIAAPPCPPPDIEGPPLPPLIVAPVALLSEPMLAPFKFHTPAPLTDGQRRR